MSNGACSRLEAVLYRVVERSRSVIIASVKVHMIKLDEGKAAQIMHLGPYSNEGPTISKLHEFIKDQGYALRGKHYEIYLGDPTLGTLCDSRLFTHRAINDATYGRCLIVGTSRRFEHTSHHMDAMQRP